MQLWCSSNKFMNFACQLWVVCLFCVVLLFLCTEVFVPLVYHCSYVAGMRGGPIYFSQIHQWVSYICKFFCFCKISKISYVLMKYFVWLEGSGARRKDSLTRIHKSEWSMLGACLECCAKGSVGSGWHLLAYSVPPYLWMHEEWQQFLKDITTLFHLFPPAW